MPFTFSEYDSVWDDLRARAPERLSRAGGGVGSYEHATVEIDGGRFVVVEWPSFEGDSGIMTEPAFAAYAERTGALSAERPPTETTPE